MGFNTTGYAWVDTGAPDMYMEELDYEAAGEDEFVAEPEFEAGTGLIIESEYFLEEIAGQREPMEEEEDKYLVDEETVIFVEEELDYGHDIPEVY